MQQASFADLAYTHKKKLTRKERFLAEMVEAHELTAALFRLTEQYLAQQAAEAQGQTWWVHRKAKWGASPDLCRPGV